MKKTVRIFLLFLIILSPLLVITQADADRGRSHMMGPMCGETGEPEWKKSLTDEQRMEMARMHRDLAREMKRLGARLDMKKAELDILVTEQRPDRSAIERKIKEISGLKAEMMMKKYAHIIELRRILTPGQRLYFDMKLLKKRGRHGHRH